MSSKRRILHNYPLRKPRFVLGKEPPRYETPEGHAYIYVFGKRYRIPVLLDSLSNIFLIDQRLIQDLNIIHEMRTDSVQIN